MSIFLILLIADTCLLVFCLAISILIHKKFDLECIKSQTIVCFILAMIVCVGWGLIGFLRSDYTIYTKINNSNVTVSKYTAIYNDGEEILTSTKYKIIFYLQSNLPIYLKTEYNMYTMKLQSRLTTDTGE